MLQERREVLMSQVEGRVYSYCNEEAGDIFDVSANMLDVVRKGNVVQFVNYDLGGYILAEWHDVI